MIESNFPNIHKLPKYMHRITNQSLKATIYSQSTIQKVLLTCHKIKRQKKVVTEGNTIQIKHHQQPKYTNDDQHFNQSTNKILLFEQSIPWRRKGIRYNQQTQTLQSQKINKNKTIKPRNKTMNLFQSQLDKPLTLLGTKINQHQQLFRFSKNNYKQKHIYNPQILITQNIITQPKNLMKNYKNLQISIPQTKILNRLSPWKQYN